MATIARCADDQPHGTHLWKPEPTFLHGDKRCPGVTAHPDREGRDMGGLHRFPDGTPCALSDAAHAEVPGLAEVHGYDGSDRAGQDASGAGEVELIAAVLAEHRAMVSGDIDGWHVICSCGYDELGTDSSAHVAEQIASRLAAATGAREADAAARAGGCGACAACDPPGAFVRMYVCATCGNKRCPASTDCLKWECSGSNDPNQGPPIPRADRLAAAQTEDGGR